MAAIARKFHANVCRMRLEGMSSREIGKKIGRSFQGVARYLASDEALQRLQTMRTAHDERIGHELAGLAHLANDHLRSVLLGKDGEGKVVKATTAEKSRVAIAILDRANQAPGVKVTVDATIRAKRLTDEETLLELAEVVELRALPDSSAESG